MRNVFETENKFPGATGEILKSLKKLQPGQLWFRRMVEVAKRLDIEFKAPYWRSRAWAHVGFPSKKAVVVMGHQLSWINGRGFREDWAEYGFKVLAICTRTVCQMTVEDLTDQLRFALNNTEELP